MKLPYPYIFLSFTRQNNTCRPTKISTCSSQQGMVRLASCQWLLHSYWLDTFRMPPLVMEYCLFLPWWLMPTGIRSVPFPRGYLRVPPMFPTAHSMPVPDYTHTPPSSFWDNSRQLEENDLISTKWKFTSSISNYASSHFMSFIADHLKNSLASYLTENYWTYTVHTQYCS